MKIIVPKNKKSLIFIFFEDPRFYNSAKGGNKIGKGTAKNMGLEIVD